MPRVPEYLQLVRRLLVFYDGGMGTMLFSAGLMDGDPPEAWNWEQPEAVGAVYRAYDEAGSDVVQTNTFGGTPIRLSEHDLEDCPRDANLLAARSVVTVRPEGRFVAGDVGPIGKFLQPVGPFRRDQFEDSFATQITALIEGGVDLVSIETMYSLEEALCALRAARRVGAVPVSVSMTFEKNPRGFFSLMGETVPHCLKVLEENGADIVGSNCNHGSSVFLDLAREIRDGTSLPVIIQPNRGRPTLEGEGVVYKQTAD